MFYLITFFVLPNLILVQVISDSNILEEGGEYYTNFWVVRILGGLEKAKEVASRLGFDSYEEVSRRLYTEACSLHLIQTYSQVHPREIRSPNPNVTRSVSEKYIYDLTSALIFPSILKCVVQCIVFL